MSLFGNYKPKGLYITILKINSTMRIKMYKQFRTYYVRCRVCGEGKPKTDFEGSWRVCSECRKKAKANKKQYKAITN